jgi:hypothetical protein
MRRETTVLALVTALATLRAPHLAARTEDQEPPAITAPEIDAAVAVVWNQKVYDIAYAEDQLLTFKGLRAFAMTNLAIHDALNAIVPVYRPYAALPPDPTAHPVAAAAQAAHDVILAQYPSEKAELDAELLDWLEGIPDGPPRQHGITLGRASASAILALREGDGWDFAGSYTFDDTLGQYRTTPPWNGFVVQPGFRFAKPFGPQSADAFRPDPPPGLTSKAYAEAYNEVKAYGSADSEVRTSEQTLYALWWMEFAEGSVNRLARDLVVERRMGLWPAARMLALIEIGLYDGYVAVWDSKYEYNHWRPYTAIRLAGRDANPATDPDALWQPLRVTPPHPEYVSAHAAGCKAAFEALRRSFGDDVPFTMTTITAPPEMPTRSFSSFSEAAAECADSRVRLGWHFRYATDRGLELGRSVAAYISRQLLQPRGDARE